MGRKNEVSGTVRIETKTTTMTQGKRKKSKTKTIYYVDEKPVELNFLERFYVRLLGIHERRAFLAKKLKQQERKAAKRRMKK